MTIIKLYSRHFCSMLCGSSDSHLELSCFLVHECFATGSKCGVEKSNPTTIFSQEIAVTIMSEQFFNCEIIEYTFS